MLAMTGSLLLALLAGDIELALVTEVKAQEDAVPFSTLVKGYQSGIRQPERLAIRTAEQWQHLWEQHAASLLAKPDLPQVDFAREMVIAIFRGETDGPFPVEIRQIVERHGALVVRYYAFTPPPGLPLGVAIRLQPYHIVKLARSSLEVFFEKEVRVQNTLQE